ncbi:MAG TPA: ZIP family metal transporter, partial [Clostridiales bacterium]|nr:ZIP family metal transporter [Clostridiales bacterium]
MYLVLITALGVGGATVIGAIVGSFFQKIPHKYNDGILGFAAGVMLTAAAFGLIQPSLEFGGDHGVWMTVAGILAGALFLNLADRFVPHLHNLAGIDTEKHAGDMKALNKTMLFVFAIAIHNFPEGLAAGVSFGTGDISGAITVATGIALQNIPEGMIIISPLLSAGLSRGKAFSIAALTGLVEVIGTFLGFWAVSITTTVLPFALAFAGGTMLYVISDEMIPETHNHGH